MHSMTARIAVLVSLAGLALGAAPPAAEAVFPGANGRLAYTIYDQGGGINTANYDGSDPRSVVTSGYDPAWSPDGTQLAFRRSSGLPGIWIVNADGSGELRIRATGYEPAWSPDGTRIVFSDGSPRRLYVMNPDGTNAAPLPVDSEGGQGGRLLTPTWSPDGEHIAYVDDPFSGYGRVLCVVAADGTDRRVVYHVPDGSPGGLWYPEWLPDGSRIAYLRLKPVDGYYTHVFTIRPDGTGEIDLGRTTANPIAWSPDGTFFGHDRRLYRADGSELRNPNLGSSYTIESWQPVHSSAANLSVDTYDFPDPTFPGGNVKYTIFVKHVSGSQAADSVVLTDTVPDSLPVEWVTSSQGSCSRDGQQVTCALGTIPPGAEAAVAINTRVAEAVNATNTATVQAAGSDPDPVNNTDSEFTEVVSGYPRPKIAQEVTFSLVPAYGRCTDGNRTHGPALAFESCHPPGYINRNLTIGTPDANGLPANSVGSARLRVLPGDLQTAADEADVQSSVSFTDVRAKASLADYTGEIQLAYTIRITDKQNGSTAVGSATMTDYAYMAFVVPCTATASTTVGATCSGVTTADALIPGVIKEGKRSVWEFDQVDVIDGGADGVASTYDNMLFATQGIFVP